MKTDSFSGRDTLDKTVYFQEQKLRRYFTKDIILTYRGMYA